MQKKILGSLLFGAFFVCAAVIYNEFIYKPLVVDEPVAIAKSKILFQGLDEVPLTSICAQNIEPSLYQRFRGFLACTPNIDEYAGAKIIKKVDTKEFGEVSIPAYSEVVYDPATKRVAGITFVMNDGAYGSVMELLETKYGEVDKVHMRALWFGDVKMNSFISLDREGATLSGIFGPAKPAYTVVTIVTEAMRIVEKATEERIMREAEARKAESLKKL